MMHKVNIEVRDDPRKGLYPNLKQYRASCNNCKWKSNWVNFEIFADVAGANHHVRESSP